MIVPYIPGDGIGPEIWAVTQKVVDRALEICYGEEKKITWVHVSAGEEALQVFKTPLPKDTLDILKEHKVSIKGPLTTPVGAGFKSINVQIRQALDLYVCLRPMNYREGVESPLKRPQDINMTIFRENTEDLYSGIEFESGTEEVKKLVSLIHNEFHRTGIRFPKTTAIGIKPISKEGSVRIVRAAIKHAIEKRLPSVTIVHKGNIMKFTEGGFKKWGYEVAKTEFAEQTYTWSDYLLVQRKSGNVHAEQYLLDQQKSGKVLIKDRIADAFFQDIVLNPKEHAVVVTSNLNGDYISDAIAGCVGGIGISPGANINYETGHAVFEATHGSAPDIAGKNCANPLSLILSAAMMLEYIGYDEAAKLIEQTANQTIMQGIVTNDLSPTKTGVSCAKYGEMFVEFMNETMPG